MRVGITHQSPPDRPAPRLHGHVEAHRGQRGLDHPGRDGAPLCARPDGSGGRLRHAQGARHRADRRRQSALLHRGYADGAADPAGARGCGRVRQGHDGRKAPRGTRSQACDRRQGRGPEVSATVPRPCERRDRRRRRWLRTPQGAQAALMAGLEPAGDLLRCPSFGEAITDEVPQPAIPSRTASRRLRR